MYTRKEGRSCPQSCGIGAGEDFAMDRLGVQRERSARGKLGDGWLAAPPLSVHTLLPTSSPLLTSAPRFLSSPPRYTERTRLFSVFV